MWAESALGIVISKYNKSSAVSIKRHVATYLSCTTIECGFVTKKNEQQLHFHNLDQCTTVSKMFWLLKD